MVARVPAPPVPTPGGRGDVSTFGTPPTTTYPGPGDLRLHLLLHDRLGGVESLPRLPVGRVQELVGEGVERRGLRIQEDREHVVEDAHGLTSRLLGGLDVDRVAEGREPRRERGEGRRIEGGDVERDTLVVGDDGAPVQEDGHLSIGRDHRVGNGPAVADGQLERGGGRRVVVGDLGWRAHPSVRHQRPEAVEHGTPGERREMAREGGERHVRHGEEQTRSERATAGGRASAVKIRRAAHARTARRFAKAWVAAGAVHVPAA